MPESQEWQTRDHYYFQRLKAQRQAIGAVAFAALFAKYSAAPPESIVLGSGYYTSTFCGIIFRRQDSDDYMQD